MSWIWLLYNFWAAFLEFWAAFLEFELLSKNFELLSYKCWLPGRIKLTSSGRQTSKLSRFQQNYRKKRLEFLKRIQDHTSKSRLNRHGQGKRRSKRLEPLKESRDSKFFLKWTKRIDLQTKERAWACASSRIGLDWQRSWGSI